MPGLSILRLEKVATPATAATVVVPLSVPLEGLVPMATVTMFVAVVTTLPLASSMLTCNAGVIEPPPITLLGCMVIATIAGGPIMLPELPELDVQPATRSEQRTETPKIFQAIRTGPCERLGIAPLLSGLPGRSRDEGARVQ